MQGPLCTSLMLCIVRKRKDGNCGNGRSQSDTKQHVTKFRRARPEAKKELSCIGGQWHGITQDSTRTPLAAVPLASFLVVVSRSILGCAPCLLLCWQQSGLVCVRVHGEGCTQWQDRCSVARERGRESCQELLETSREEWRQSSAEAVGAGADVLNRWQRCVREW